MIALDREEQGAPDACGRCGGELLPGPPPRHIRVQTGPGYRRCAGCGHWSLPGFQPGGEALDARRREELRRLAELRGC